MCIYVHIHTHILLCKMQLKEIKQRDPTRRLPQFPLKMAFCITKNNVTTLNGH